MLQLKWRLFQPFLQLALSAGFVKYLTVFTAPFVFLNILFMRKNVVRLMILTTEEAVSLVLYNSYYRLQNQNFFFMFRGGGALRTLLTDKRLFSLHLSQYHHQIFFPAV